MSKEKKFEENLVDLKPSSKNWKVGMWLLKKLATEFQRKSKLSKELQDTLDQAEKTFVRVMQADGTEADLA